MAGFVKNEFTFDKDLGRLPNTSALSSKFPINLAGYVTSKRNILLMHHIIVAVGAAVNVSMD